MEQNNPLVSIVVPIYRIERYIGKCIESILNQTYRNLEIILVDDGSDDRCPDLCDLYQTKDTRIKVIHKENGGLVSARKAGVQAAAGEYIGYVDGDDWLDRDFVQTMVDAASKNDSDIVCAAQSRDLFEQSIYLANSYPAGIYTGHTLDLLKSNMLSYGPFYRPGIMTYVWNKLFKRDILYPCQMNADERISIGEDAAVTYPAIMNSDCVSVINCASYHYRQHEASMLKRNADFSVEMTNLRYLYEYLLDFAEKYDEKFHLKKQVVDYVLGICIMRFGGRLLGKNSYSIFDDIYYGKDVVIFNAGTFGQQLVNRFNQSRHCRIVKWIDDDFWEYRRCCMNVDSVESVTEIDFDYVLVAAVDCFTAEKIKQRLIGLNVSPSKILTVECPEDVRETLIDKYLY